MPLHGLHHLIADLFDRYQRASKAEKSALLDQLCSIHGIHRKHAIRLLAHPPRSPARRPGRPRQYPVAEVLEPLITIWKTTNLICSKRLVACLPYWVPHYRDDHGNPLPAEVQGKLCAMSAATIDRLLADCRRSVTKLGLSTTKPGTLLRKRIPIRTQQWEESRPGFVEADTVAHCGTSMSGMFVFTLALTDIATAWIEHRATWGRGETGVCTQLHTIEEALPFRLRGFDCDNGSEFLNHHLLKYFLKRKTPVEFTRSRPYCKNDNAHIEQKNWTHVRQYLGYARFDNPAIVPALNDLYTQEWRLFFNFFLPSVKLLDKRREGAKQIKIHDAPKTPYHRVLELPEIAKTEKRRLREQYRTLDPFVLQRAISKKIRAILKMVPG